jgi:hypothetical protein
MLGDHVHNKAVPLPTKEDGHVPLPADRTRDEYTRLDTMQVRCREWAASPSELLASPSQLLASPSELSASPSELLASPSET